MAQAVRTAWNASRHWLATGFLASTILFLLLMFINWRNEHRGIASQKATGLTSVSVDSASVWHQKSILPWSSTERHVRSGLDSISASPGGMTGGVLGGVPGSVQLAVNGSQPATPLENTERMVVRTGTLDIIVVDPVQAAEQMRDLATHLSGFVVSRSGRGRDARTQPAQVAVRNPAKYFDGARPRGVGWRDRVRSSLPLTLELTTRPERCVARSRICSAACTGSTTMISSVPVRTTIRSVFSNGVAGCEPFTANWTLPGTPPSTPPVIPPGEALMESRPDRTCRSVLDHGRMLFWCHTDAESTETDVNPVAFCEAMPRCSFRQFMNIKSRNKIVEARNPVASQWRLAFQAVRTACAI